MTALSIPHEERSATGRRRVYHSLDFIRGVAAVAVVTRHAGILFWPIPLSYLAVDLFFVLSGFVLAHAYEERLMRGESFFRFMAIRLIRLYPLYLIGLLLSAIYLITLRAPAIPAPQLGVPLLLALVMLPEWAGGWSTQLLDPPRWSLTYELVANILYALMARFLTAPRLLLVCMLSALGLLISYFAGIRADAGWDMQDAGYAVSRVCFSFFTGVFCYRLHQGQIGKPLLWIAYGSAFVLAAVGWVAFDVKHAVALTIILLVWPPLVFFAARYDVPGRWAPLCAFLGVASYAVYVLHQPIAMIAIALLAPLGFGGHAFKVVGLFILMGLLVLSWVLDTFYDKPVRRWLVARVPRG